MASVVADGKASAPAGHKRARPRQHRPANCGDQPDSHPAQSVPSHPSAAKVRKLDVVTEKCVQHLNSEENGKVKLWGKDTANELLNRIKAALPATDNLKYSTQMEKLDWSNVQFGEFSADDCREQWDVIIRNLRRFRTLSELLADAADWVKCPPTKKKRKGPLPPGMPKKPLTPYFRFFTENRAQVGKENPHLSMTELTKFISERYRSMSDPMKMKYSDAYNSENMQYKALMIRYKEEHPEEAATQPPSTPDYRPVAGGNAPKLTTAGQIYMTIKVTEHLKKYPHVSKKQLIELYRKSWAELGDNKKMKYIRKALDAKLTYDANMEAYCKLNPDFVPKEVKSFLTKAEQKVKDRHGGKPDKPPINGFHLFTTRLVIPELPSSQRMTEISRRWKALTDAERAAFNDDALRKMVAYNEQFGKYLESLPEEERIALGGATTKKVESPPASPEKKQPPAERCTKPIAPMFIFMDEKESEYRKKHPKMEKKELSRLMLQDFNGLPSKEKTKYKKMAAQRKEKLAQQNKENAHCQEKPKPLEKLHFPGEPKKPPSSGYHIFSTSMLTMLTHVVHNERMAEISRRWRNMSAQEHKEYAIKRDVLNTKYVTALEHFKKGLSPKDLKRYEDYEKAKKQRRQDKINSTQASKAKTKAPEPEPESGSEAESDAGSSSESESGSSSESDEAENTVEQTNSLQKKDTKLHAGDVYGDDEDDDDDSNDSASGSSEDESEAESESDSDNN